MITAAAATIIAGIVAATGAFASSKMQNNAQEKAGKESKALAFIARGDELTKQSNESNLNQQAINVKKDELGLSKIKTMSDIRQSNKVAKQSQIANLGNALTLSSQKDQNMTNFIMSLYGKTGVKQ